MKGLFRIADLAARVAELYLAIELLAEDRGPTKNAPHLLLGTVNDTLGLLVRPNSNPACPPFVTACRCGWNPLNSEIPGVDYHIRWRRLWMEHSPYSELYSSSFTAWPLAFYLPLHTGVG